MGTGTPAVVRHRPGPSSGSFTMAPRDKRGHLSCQRLLRLAPQLGVASAALLTTTRPNLDVCPTLLPLGRGSMSRVSWLTPVPPASKENPGFWKRCFLLRTSCRPVFTSSLGSLPRPLEVLLHGSLAGFHSLGPLIYTFGLESLFLSPLPLCHSSVPFIAQQNPDYHTRTGLSAVSSPSPPLCHLIYSLAGPWQDTLTSP